MSYQVLARKWRPRTFSELVGQEHVVAAISNALDNKRLHHAYLFTGTRGVGKTTIARIFAKSLNCEQGMSANPCGVCDTCRDVEAGNYVDLLEIDAASRTKVEDTRELLDNVQYRPSRGEYKVYLIDEVHMLSKHSFNALLKTLEEPPPHVKFLLATTDPQKLPVTILSRCLQFNLKALSREQITHQLDSVLTQEGIDFSHDGIELLARAAHGSMRDALSLTDQAIAQGNGEVKADLVVNMLGLMDKTHLLKLLNALVHQDSAGLFAIVDDMAQKAPDFAQVLQELASLLHQIALTQFVPSACKLETVHAAAINKLAKLIAPELVQIYYQMAVKGQQELPFCGEPKSGFEMVVLRMLTFTPAPPVENAESVISSHKVAVHLHNENETSLASSEPEPDDVDGSISLSDEQRSIELQAGMYREAAVADLPPMTDDEYYQQAIQDDFESAPSYYEESDVANSLSQPSVSTTAVSALERTKALMALRAANAKAKATSNDKEKYSDPQNNPATAKNEVKKKFIDDEHPTDVDSQVRQPAHVESDSSTLTKVEANDSFAQNTEAVAEEQSPTIDDYPPWEDSPSADPKADTKTNPLTSVESVEAVETIDTSTLPAYLASGDKLVKALQIDEWSAIADRLELSGLMKQVVLNSSFMKNDQQIELVLAQEHQHLLDERAHKIIQHAMSEYFNEEISLNITLGSPEISPMQIQQQVDEMRVRHAQHVVANDAIINTIKQVFNASVDESSIKPR